jgi:ComF family protein
MKLKPILSDFFALFFPNYCFGCRDGLVHGEEILCTRCIAELPRLDYFQLNDNPITDRFVGRLSIKHGWALLKFQKSGIVQNLLHELKYNNHPEIGIKLGKILANSLLQHSMGSDIDLIIPVPLHRNRLRVRGYNQSVMIAKGVSEVLSIPYDDSNMIRLSATKTQTKKSKVDRWENVSQVFQVAKPEVVVGKRVLLVDDVITTGATIEACAQKLLSGGAAEISIACLAEVL